MDLLSSALLAGFPHGFTTRRGEASGEAFASFNLGGAVGDDGARVAENWRALRNATGLAFARVLQVHGDRVLVATEGVEPGEEADAVLSTRPGVAACVSVADCVPVLIGDPRSGAVVAVHAGWRGTLAHAAARAVEALSREVGAQPGEEPRSGSSRVDLWLANELVLRQAGLSRERIEVLGRCTSCEPDTFFSHRRDRGRTGRQVGFIAPAPSPLS